MIHPLPAETVFEAKERARRATVILFILLVVIYTFFANLMVFVTLLIMEYPAASLKQDGWSIFGLSTLVAFLIGWIHFAVARGKTLEQILGRLGARDTDPKDEYHARFINIVHEAEAALGGRIIKPVIISSVGMNAFSIEDGRGKAAIDEINLAERSHHHVLRLDVEVQHAATVGKLHRLTHSHQDLQVALEPMRPAVRPQRVVWLFE